ncbi:CHRD domain-containing protein [Cytobacillus firmus]|uniref:CHRD domain-containing protein n=1 Tax=Cytobacillus firmus TaxID=1399 RepID=UPI001C8E1B4D|nr:CHRD domain-containing protein [Cytobacillus firmus]MBX9975912.1 CHRD domain-containing protein [Cytobacillus firmus]
MLKFFKARLKGENEVPPVETNAFGFAKFAANKNRTKIKFALEVENIKNFVQAHIHFGKRGVNGPVIVFLFGADLETLEEQNGITTRRGVVTGIITDDDIVENDAGIETVEDLLKFMEKELTYVNAHTEQNPSGEIRGQIVPI